VIDNTSQIISTLKIFVIIGIIEKLARAIVRVIVLRPISAKFVVYKVRFVPEIVRKFSDGDIVKVLAPQ
jgi:hypothetical protein